LATHLNGSGMVGELHDTGRIFDESRGVAGSALILSGRHELLPFLIISSGFVFGLDFLRGELAGSTSRGERDQRKLPSHGGQKSGSGGSGSRTRPGVDFPVKEAEDIARIRHLCDVDSMVADEQSRFQGRKAATRSIRAVRNGDS